jgi:hypothetical protein
MKAIRYIVVFFLISVPLSGRADTNTDWGLIVTPITNDITFAFSQQNITKNFTDQYAFSLQGGAGVDYTLTFNFDPCKNGCGNPDLRWGIYNQNGGLVSELSTNGSYTLTSGNYTFEVKGTGMGAGNTVDYAGTMTFSTGMMTSVPDGEGWVLSASGLLFLGLMKKRKMLRAQVRTWMERRTCKPLSI